MGYYMKLLLGAALGFGAVVLFVAALTGLLSCGSVSPAGPTRTPPPWRSPWRSAPGSVTPEETPCGEPPLLSPSAAEGHCFGGAAPVWACVQVAGSGPLEQEWEWRWVPACL